MVSIILKIYVVIFKSRHLICERTVFHGAMRIRTADPLNAIEVLYQLSYNPLSAFSIVP